MKRLFQLSAFSFLVLASCSTLDPNADPVVVNAEKTIKLSFHAVDAFLTFEKNNADLIKRTAPDAHAYAEYVRRNARNWFRSATALTDAYRTSRTAENKANLQTALQVLQVAQSEALRYTAAATTSTPAPSP